MVIACKISSQQHVSVLPTSGTLQPITDDIMFALVSSSPVQFSLTCTSTGGPATSVTWTRDGVNVNYDSTHVLTRTVENTMTAQYSNTLTVTGVEGGSYQCIVSNVRGAVMSPVLSGAGRLFILRTYHSTITMWSYSLAPSVPRDVAASEPTNSSVRVTWTAPNDNIEVLEYQVSIERLTGTGCDSSHNATKSVSSRTTNDTVTGLSGFSTYRISVTAINIFGSSLATNSNPISTLPRCESCVHVSLHVQWCSYRCRLIVTCNAPLPLHSPHWPSNWCQYNHCWQIHHCLLESSPLPAAQQSYHWLCRALLGSRQQQSNLSRHGWGWQICYLSDN